MSDKPALQYIYILKIQTMLKDVLEDHFIDSVCTIRSDITLLITRGETLVLQQAEDRNKNR